MTGSSTLRIAILSDIHAFTHEKGDGPSWINLSADQSNVIVNPFAGLNDLIARDQSIRADMVLCCGDMGDKASPDGQQYVWTEINRLKTNLEASLVAATAGNHDMDSRFQNTKYDARGQLQSLSPRFPIDDNDNWMEYWAKNYTIFEFSNVRFVLLNSAAYHGYHPNGEEPEYVHGRISDRTLDSLSEDLKSRGKAKANVLVCHHHPIQNDQIKTEDYSAMKNGDRLINDLVKIKVGPWLIIHGHKHLSRVIYASGTNSAPTIFSAGSFSARLYPEFQEKARNEFYILELEVPNGAAGRSNLLGKISTWQWTFGNGWRRPKVGHGLGPTAAFGARIDIAEEAEALVSEIRTSQAGGSIEWREVCGLRPKLEYLIPEDLETLLDHLGDEYKVELLHDSNGEIRQIKVPGNG